MEAGWDDLRTAVGNTDFLPTVRVFTGVDGKSRIKARFGRITDSGLVLTKNGKPLSIDRSEVHSIRLVPRKASTRKHRNAAAIAAAPIGFGASYGLVLLTCSISNRCVDGAPVGSSRDCLPSGNRRRRRTLPRLSAGTKGRPWISRFRTEELTYHSGWSTDSGRVCAGSAYYVWRGSRGRLYEPPLNLDLLLDLPRGPNCGLDPPDPDWASYWAKQYRAD